MDILNNKKDCKYPVLRKIKNIYYYVLHNTK